LHCATICRNQATEAGKDPRNSLLQPAAPGRVSSEADPNCTELYMVGLGKPQGLETRQPIPLLPLPHGGKKFQYPVRIFFQFMPVVFPKY